MIHFMYFLARRIYEGERFLHKRHIPGEAAHPCLYSVEAAAAAEKILAAKVRGRSKRIRSRDGGRRRRRRRRRRRSSSSSSSSSSDDAEVLLILSVEEVDLVLSRSWIYSYCSFASKC